MRTQMDEKFETEIGDTVLTIVSIPAWVKCCLVIFGWGVLTNKIDFINIINIINK
jgi:hypothetical protein